MTAAIAFLYYDYHASGFDAQYVSAEVCGGCHTQIFPEWQRSPHANMTRRPSPQSVVGDFDNASWTLPESAQRLATDIEPAVQMYMDDGKYFMALRHPQTEEFVPFEIAYVIGYQYRQVYLTREANGVLRRLPLQWSVRRQEYFPYWNLQEHSTPSVNDFWAQMTSLNSAWNLFCARCHTTHLEILDKDINHTRADARWVDDGIACEACHGPGSLHVAYFQSNYVNRVAEYVNSKIRKRPVAYIANAKKLDKGRAMSVCARCHGTDIFMSATDIYRIYEPGYSRKGRTNDLSPYFYQTPLTPGRQNPTVEVWSDGEPKGIGTLFRSLVESQCYKDAEVRCYDCHNPHDNKQEAIPGILHPSDASNNYCLGCHQELRNSVAEHSRHQRGQPGAFCYDCHMPKKITKLATGIWESTRTHKMSTIPRPGNSIRFGMENAPNACNQCHDDQTPQWALQEIINWSDEST